MMMLLFELMASEIHRRTLLFSSTTARPSRWLPVPYQSALVILLRVPIAGLLGMLLGCLAPGCGLVPPSCPYPKSIHGILLAVP